MRRLPTIRLSVRTFSTTFPVRTAPLAALPPLENRRTLPPQSQWKKHWGSIQAAVRDRASVSNPDTAALLADSLVPEGSKDKVIIEAFPGPGALTRALMELPKERVKRLIVMEEHEPYLEWLRCLADSDPRVVILPANAWLWDSYQSLEALGYLDDVAKLEWTGGVHNQLQFVSHLAKDVYSEQLIAQLFRTIPDAQWLFQYGRVPMSFILTNHIYDRISADITHKLRGKLSVIAEATAELAHPIDPLALQPYNDHFFPPPSAKSLSTNPKKRGVEFQALNVIPREQQLIRKGMLEKWDYVLRRLFVLKASDLKRAMPSLAPGAESLLKTLTDPTLPDNERVDIKKRVSKLTLQDWYNVVQAFHRWPFAPQDLLITDSLINKNNRRHTE